MAYFNGISSADLDVHSWQVPSYGSGEHVQIARLLDGHVAIANSAYPPGPALIITPAQMDALIQSIKAGEYDHLADGPGRHTAQPPGPPGQAAGPPT